MARTQVLKSVLHVSHAKRVSRVLTVKPVSHAKVVGANAAIAAPAVSAAMRL